jgi:hypothetical protein
MGAVIKPIADASPQPRARIIGVVYLLYFLFALSTLFSPLALMLWLLVRGVNVQRWRERAGT